jgi:hypothetical protein
VFATARCVLLRPEACMCPAGAQEANGGATAGLMASQGADTGGDTGADDVAAQPPVEADAEAAPESDGPGWASPRCGDVGV